MFDIDVPCDCGQKYVFEVEPVENRMPTAVACPACGKDGTSAANIRIRHRIAEEAAREADRQVKIEAREMAEREAALEAGREAERVTQRELERTAEVKAGTKAESESEREVQLEAGRNAKLKVETGAEPKAEHVAGKKAGPEALRKGLEAEELPSKPPAVFRPVPSEVEAQVKRGGLGLAGFALLAGLVAGCVFLAIRASRSPRMVYVAPESVAELIPADQEEEEFEAFPGVYYEVRGEKRSSGSVVTKYITWDFAQDGGVSLSVRTGLGNRRPSNVATEGAGSYTISGNVIRVALDNGDETTYRLMEDGGLVSSETGRLLTRISREAQPAE